MLDDAVLAGGVHRLKHDQDRPAVSGIKSLLQILEALDAILEKIFRLVLREAERFVRTGISDTEAVGLVDPKAFGDVSEVHDEASLAGGHGHNERRNTAAKSGTAASISWRPRSTRMSASSGESFTAQMGERLGTQRLGIMPRAQHLHRHNARRQLDDAPARLDAEFSRVETGLFLELAGTGMQEIDLAADDVVAIGRPAREIDLPGITGVSGHLAEDHGAVRR